MLVLRLKKKKNVQMLSIHNIQLIVNDIKFNINDRYAMKSIVTLRKTNGQNVFNEYPNRKTIQISQTARYHFTSGTHQMRKFQTKHVVPGLSKTVPMRCDDDTSYNHIGTRQN